MEAPPGALDLRERMVLGLAIVFVVVSIIAYSDFPRREEPVLLDEIEQDGQRLWRKFGCQSCHQLHGFGGFLGPDLTNRVREDTPDGEIGPIIEFGSGRMPAFRVSVDEQDALIAYLRAMNRTGVSSPPPLGVDRIPELVGHLSSILEESSRDGETLPARTKGGLDAWGRHRCGSCHVPFAVGRSLAPDLSAASVDRSPNAMEQILSRGRSRMPSFQVSAEEVGALSELLEWIAFRRESLIGVNNRLQGRTPFRWSGIPWFEYPR